MRHRPRTLATTTAVVVLAAAVVCVSDIAGCATPRQPGGPGAPRYPIGTSTSVPPPGSRKIALPQPEIEDLDGGRVLATGWLAEMDLEGGTWVLLDQPPWSSVGSKTVAVLVPGKVTVEQLDRLRGSFVGAEGVRGDGVSIRMQGSELIVDAIRVY